MAEKRYRVINQTVEINDRLRQVGDELAESEFRPASGNSYEDWGDVPRDPATGIYHGKPTLRDEPSELESLLATGHIEEIG